MKKNSLVYYQNTQKTSCLQLRKLNVLIIISILILSVTSIVAQSSTAKSSNLELLHYQIERDYIPQKWKSQLKWNVDSIAKIIPYFYVKITGYAMYNQKKYIKSQSDRDRFNNTHNEILSLIPSVANSYNKLNYKNNNFFYHDLEELKNSYLDAFNGELSDDFKQKYIKHSGKDITQVNSPFIFDKDHEPAGIKRARNNSIDLLGVEAEKVEHDLEYDINDEMPLPEDVIVGTWVESKTGKAIQFQKKGNGYVSQFVKILGAKRIPVFVYLDKTQIRKAVYMYYGEGRSYQGTESFTYNNERYNEDVSFVVEWDKSNKRYKVWLTSLKMNPGGLFYKQ